MSSKDMGKVIKETIKVVCRLRPSIPEDENARYPFMEDMEENGVDAQDIRAMDRSFQSISGHGDNNKGAFTYRRSAQEPSSKDFRFDGFFGPHVNQREVYDAAGRDIVRGVIEGYNGTIFAYGQTGSGKTYTMRGPVYEDEEDEAHFGQNRHGVTLRALADIFESVHHEQSNEITVSISYVQIYCEILQDLLEPSNTNLSIREKDGRVFVEGICRVPVQSLTQCKAMLAEGDANRATACTRLNATSSRSHAALLVHLTRREASPVASSSSRLGDTTMTTMVESTLYLVDLAGSERAKQHTGGGGMGGRSSSSSSSNNHQRFQELKAINLSLSALGNCISALSQSRPHIPYRDSKLTRLLQQSLGGNSRTCLIVNLPPGPDINGESHGSLLFAQRAMSITVMAKVNRQVDYAQLYSSVQAKLDQKDDVICRLQIENAKLIQDQGNLQNKVEELRLGKEELENKLFAAESGFKEALNAMHNASTDPGGERAVAAIESVSEKWRQEIANLESSHAKELKELKLKYEKRTQGYKQGIDQANEGWQAVEVELTREREEHLQTLTDYRKCHERLLNMESETSARIGELLADVNEKMNQMEDLQSQLHSTQTLLKEKKEIIQTLREKVTHLEKHGSSSSISDDNQHHHPIAAGALVPLNQVEIMEQLFTETVGKLETRVAQLETTATTVTTTTAIEGSSSYYGPTSVGGRGVVRLHPTSKASLSSSTRRCSVMPAAVGGGGGGGERPAVWAARRGTVAAAAAASSTSSNRDSSSSSRPPHHQQHSSSSSITSNHNGNTSLSRHARSSSNYPAAAAAATVGRERGHSSSTKNTDKTTFGGRSSRFEPGGRVRGPSSGNGSRFGIGPSRYGRPAFQL